MTVTWPAAVVKATLLLVGAVIAIGTALGALVAAEMWDPPHLFSGDVYNQLFTAHGAVSVFGGLLPLGLLLVANLVVADVIRPVRSRLRAFAWIGLGAGVLAVGAALVPWVPPVAAWLRLDPDQAGSFGPMTTFYAIAFASTAASAIAAFGRHSGPLGPAGLAAAWGSIVCLLWAAVIMTTLAVWIGPVAPGDTQAQADAWRLMGAVRIAWSISIASLLPHAIERATGKRFGPPWAIAVVALSYAVGLVSTSAGEPAAFVGAAIAVIFTARALRRTPRPLSVASLYAMLGVLPMVGLTALLDTFLSAPNGRARRYGEYDPVFELSHRIAVVGTVAMVLGGILLVAAFVWRGRRVPAG